MKFTIHQISRPGTRKYNQDRIAYSYSKNSLMTVIADGMGGHRYGEVAAQIAIKTLTDAFQRMAVPIISDPFKFLSDHLIQIHDAIDSYAAQQDWLEHPRTTIVAAIAQQNELFCAHVGDSRLYHFRDGRMLYRTEDHSQVQLMFNRGKITKEEMLTHPDRNRIYNSLGGDNTPQIELSHKRLLLEGDTILLCTDGLWSLLGDDEMARIMQYGTVTDAMPTLFETAENRIEQHADNMSGIAFNWGDLITTAFSVSTETMPFNGNTTVTQPTLLLGRDNMQDYMDSADFSEKTLDEALAEIQAALKNREG